MLADLPMGCALGTKRNAKGYKTSWIGYKLHIDTADGDIPVSCLLTSASLHEQPGGASAGDHHGGRVTNLYISWTARTTRPRSRKGAARSATCPLSIPTRGAAARRKRRPKRAPGAVLATLWPKTSASRSEAPPKRQQRAQGQLRRPLRACAPSRQGALPPDVRYPGRWPPNN